MGFQKDLGNRLKYAREQAGLTQEQSARITAWSRPIFSQLEGGSRKLSSEEAVILSDLYDVDVGWLLNGEQQGGFEFGYAARELEKLKDGDLDVVLRLMKSMNRKKPDED